jgi:hypothetical protein
MESIGFVVSWNAEDYKMAYKRLYAPAWRRFQGWQFWTSLLGAAAGALALAVVAGFMGWFLFSIVKWHLVLAVLGTIVFTMLCIMLGLSEASPEIKSHIDGLTRTGPYLVEATAGGLKFQFTDGSNSEIPWEAMKLLESNAYGWLLLHDSMWQPILIPTKALGENAARFSDLVSRHL